MGLGVPGIERQAPARPDGGVTRGECGSQSRPTGAHHGLWRTKWPVNAGSRHPPRIYLAGRPRKLLRHDEAKHGPTTQFTPRYLLRRRLLGDTTVGLQLALACPVNKLGNIDLYQVPHHGNGVAPQLTWALEPTVAVVNNGPHKGGGAEGFQVVADSPRLETSGSRTARSTPTPPTARPMR